MPESIDNLKDKDFDEVMHELFQDRHEREGTMETITEVVLKKIESTKKRFYDRYGKNCQDSRRMFVNWYIETHNAPLSVLINDLSEYYLHISEDTIIRYLNAPE